MGAEDGGTAAVEVGAAEGVLGEDVPGADVLGLGVTDGLAVVVATAGLLVGAAAGGPKQPVSTMRLESPNTLNAESLVMMPPWVRPRPVAGPHFENYSQGFARNRDFSPALRVQCSFGHLE